ncbi:hypothetical protein [Paenisporosarcina sp.]|uniref:hypothetical protein n=1 Tax=Paenisporosarcina sp. TaxID=1932001 RepID=UPI003C770013
MPKPSIFVFLLLPLISALISLGIPIYKSEYMVLTAIIYLGYALILFIVKGMSTFNGKIEWFPKFAGYATFTALAFFFVMPLIKIFDGEIGIQLLLIVIWLVFHIIFFVKVETFYKIVLPTAGESKSKWSIVYYLTFIVLFAISGGGNFRVTRIMTETYGQNPTMAYFSFVMYIVGIWFGTLAAVLSIGMQGKLPKGRVERKVQKGKLVRNKYS